MEKPVSCFLLCFAFKPKGLQILFKLLKLTFVLSEFESRLESSESLEKEMEARLGNTEKEVDALKSADQGNAGRPSGISSLAAMWTIRYSCADFLQG